LEVITRFDAQVHPGPIKSEIPGVERWDVSIDFSLVCQLVSGRYIKATQAISCAAKVEGQFPTPATITVCTLAGEHYSTDWIHVNFMITYHKRMFNAAPELNHVFLESWIPIIQDDHFTDAS
jgi:hypothetical protein